MKKLIIVLSVCFANMAMAHEFDNALPQAAGVMVKVDAEGNSTVYSLTAEQTAAVKDKNAEAAVLSAATVISVEKKDASNELDRDSSTQAWCWWGFGGGHHYGGYYGGGYGYSYSPWYASNSWFSYGYSNYYYGYSYAYSYNRYYFYW